MGGKGLKTKQKKIPSTQKKKPSGSIPRYPDDDSGSGGGGGDDPAPGILSTHGED